MSKETETKANRIILVTGISGQQGGSVARQLIGRGFSVRGYVRDLSNAKSLALKKLGVDLRQGAFEDTKSLRDAIVGVDGMFLNTPPGPNQVDLGKAIIDIAKSENLQHLVYSSYLVADEEHGLSNFPKAIIECYLRDSGVPNTILRPTTFMENFSGEGAKEHIKANGIADPRSAEVVRQFISVEDIAYFAADAFSDTETWIGRALNITGDEMTGTELVDLISKVTGSRVEYIKADWDVWATRMPPGHPEMYHWLEDSGFKADLAPLKKQYSELRGLEQFLRETGWES